MGTARAATGFPDHYAEFGTERLLDIFEAAPGRFDLALSGLEAPDLHARPIAGKWSVHEIVCHVADSETCGAFRIRLALSQPGAALPSYDQDRFAAGLAYEGFDRELFARIRELFRGLRAVSARLLRGLPEESWGRMGVHPQWGPVTVRQLLELYADHGERHLQQVLDRRAKLGKPLTMPPLLAARLY